MATVEDLQKRLAALAEAVQTPVPPLKVVPDPKGHTVPAYVRKDDLSSAAYLQVTDRLVAADPAEQTWYLAAALGWWTSPLPRRRRRQAVAAVGAVIVAYGGWLLVDVFDAPVPGWAPWLAFGLSAFALPVALAAVMRRGQRALDAAGHDVLRSAGHDPAALARQVFGNRPRPSWFARLVGTEPSPATRIADAERARSLPARPLF